MIPAGVLSSAQVAAGDILTWQSPSYTGSSATSVTTSGVNIGTASSTRQVVAVYAWLTIGVNRGITGVTIGGVTATADINTGNYSTGFAVYRATVPTGTTASIVTTWTSTDATFTLAVFTSAVSLTVSGTANTAITVGNTSASVNPASTPGGYAVAGGSRADAGTMSFTGVTDVTTAAQRVIGGAPTPASSHSVTATISSTSSREARFGAVTYAA